MADSLIALAIHHYVVVGLVVLCVGIGLNLLFRCGPELIETARHPRLN